jgi:predicted amidohydrolase YtcJ
MLNSAALEELRVDERSAPPGAERDAVGRLTGRFHRADDWLAEQLAARGHAVTAAPDLAGVAAELSRVGITGVTDATADLSEDALQVLTTANGDGELPQRLYLLGAATTAPLKIVLSDHELPAYDDIRARVLSARKQHRGVAVHCVTAAAVSLLLAVFDELGVHPDDRIEHGAVLPDWSLDRLAAFGVAVVTQPLFVHDRGDDYRRDVEPDDRDCLYRYASLIAANIRVAPSSDAPYSAADPWRIMAAARDRTTRSGTILGASERVPTQRTLAGFLSHPTRPGGVPRQVRPGEAADLCLLRVPLEGALAAPCADVVRRTIIDGKTVYSRD